MKQLKRAISTASNIPVEEEVRIKNRRQLGLLIPRKSAVADGDNVGHVRKKITMDDLRQSTSTALGARSLARLDELEKRAKGKSEVVKSRLGRRLEVRVDRAAAYEIAKENVAKWEETVKRNREAEHLEFPLQAAAVPSADAAGLDDEDEMQGEQFMNALEGRELTFDEVKQRRLDLRRMRELMFREEMKAKRVKKIKSKTYHKIQKRARERAQQVAAQLDEDSDAEKDGDDYDKLVQRARERMDLRHKNKSKWARDVKRMSLNKDKNARGELEEMLRRGEELTRKIDGDNEYSSEDDAVANLLDDEVEEEEQPKGVMAMKFMKEADGRIRKQNQEALRELQQLENGEEVTTEEQPVDSSLKVMNDGRRKYAPGTAESKSALRVVMEESDQIDSALAPLAKKFSTITTAMAGGSSTSSAKKLEPRSKETSNPWIQDVDPGSVTKGKSLLSLSKDSTQEAKSEAKLKRAKRKSKAAQKAATGETGDVKIDLNEILQVHDVHDDAAGDDGLDEAVPDSAVKMLYNGGRRAKLSEFQQRELVRRAFAGDDVVREFAEEKQRVVEDEGDKEIDMTLPGWGSWTGKGVRKQGDAKKFVKKIEGVAADKRKDSKLKNVIINEKAAKKSAKYTASQVPFPYETREQYERALRMPIGKEWSTQTTLQRMTKPKIIVKPGVVVEPLTNPFSS
ncbi:Utp14 protein-domain-containing protein [Lipomyces arxii]|uniref:Utp14 protein-domain-containing protein n=1 Tax=Lipomyces arxii TaxID=56418 RepID=UPI0034CD79C9